MDKHVDFYLAVDKWIGFFSNLIKPFEEYRFEGNPKDHLLGIVRRSVAIRQLEAVQAIQSMCKTGHGHFGVTLLRPAFEELIWMEYLAKNAIYAKEIVPLIAQSEISESLSVQNEYIGSAGMAAHGFSQRYIKTTLARLKPIEARLRQIGKELGWRDGSTLPSVAFMARKIGREKEYKFIYHGTSRYVHFSTHELLRRAWSQNGHTQISSRTFSSYWQDFATYWSFRILLDLLVGYEDLIIQTSVNDGIWKDLQASLEAISPVPIITSKELAGWN